MHSASRPARSRPLARSSAADASALFVVPDGRAPFACSAAVDWPCVWRRTSSGDAALPCFDLPAAGTGDCCAGLKSGDDTGVSEIACGIHDRCSRCSRHGRPRSGNAGAISNVPRADLCRPAAPSHRRRLRGLDLLRVGGEMVFHLVGGLPAPLCDRGLSLWRARPSEG